MLNKSRVTFLKWVTFTLDFIFLIASFRLAYMVRNSYFRDPFNRMENLTDYLWVPLLAVPVWLLFLYLFRLYRLKQNIIVIFLKCAATIFIGAIILASVFYFSHDNGLSRLFFFLYSLFAGISIFWIRVFAKLIMALLQYSRKGFKRVIVAGTNQLAKKFTDFIHENSDLMIDIVGYVQVSEEVYSEEFNVIGKIDDLSALLKFYVADEVVFALSREYIDDLEPHILTCESMGVTASLIADLFNLQIAKVRIGNLGTLPILSYHSVSLDYRQLFLKRLLDIVGALIGLAATAVLFILVAPAICIESPGPVFFSQVRVGMNGRVFRCYKFRSMYPDAEGRKKELMASNLMNGNMFKVKDDPRVTRVGKVIRALSIDEFPQFWNVLVGDMSLVGTRPPTVDEVQKYEDSQRRRLSIKPGLTGMWQVSGRNNINDFDEIVKLDTSYIDNWSIWLDFKIIFKTLKVVAVRNGAL